MVDPNTRQGKRTPVTLKIKFKSETIEQFIERYAVDVSQGGIFIRTKEPLAVGTQMRFEFQLRDASPLIGGEGTVVWTRENDPSRPAIAPGMGVRFDRLADGSQTVLERILADKAKQAPQRSAAESTRPPMFTDTPTRVAPLPVQEALLGSRARAGESFGEQTPLPKPVPFHSDAEDFDEKAFEEATQIRSLDDLVAQTANAGHDHDAHGSSTVLIPADELAARRSQSGLVDAVAEPAASDDATAADDAPEPAAQASSMADRDSAPVLPNPPETKQPRLLDTTPSPRTEPAGEHARTQVGFEPAAKAAVRAGTPSQAPALKEPARTSAVRAAVAAEPSGSSRLPSAPQKSSAMPAIILLLVLIAAAGAGVWFFYLRPKAEQAARRTLPTPPPPVPDRGSGVIAAGGSTGSDTQPGSGSPMVGSANPDMPKAATVDTKITASADTATVVTVEVVGTDQRGPAPLTATLEKDRAYQVRVSAPRFVTAELEVKGGQEPPSVKLEPKPRVITIGSEPSGALIFIDNAATGFTTPRDVELTKVAAAKKSVKITLRKAGYRPLERMLAADAFTESDAKLVAKLQEKMTVAPAQVRPPPDRGSAAGSATLPVDKPPEGAGSGSAATPTPTSTTPTTPTPTPTTPTTGAGSAAKPAEPEPTFVKPTP